MAGGVAPKGGRKGRKVGKGKHKVASSRFVTYAGIMAHSEKKRLLRQITRERRLDRRALKRECNICHRSAFRDRRALKRHRKFGHPGHTQ
jgi:hypothetical protein